jgi:hypothetical protein
MALFWTLLVLGIGAFLAGMLSGMKSPPPLPPYRPSPSDAEQFKHYLG